MITFIDLPPLIKLKMIREPDYLQDATLGGILKLFRRACQNLL